MDLVLPFPKERIGMELKQLQYFVEFCKDKNFSRAAKRLYITPQGLSKSIRQLENELNIPLLEQNKGKLDLSPYGAFLERRSIALLNQAERLTRDIKLMYESENTCIAINLSNSIRSIIYAEVHNKFRQLYPEIQLTIHEYTDIECEKKLLDGEIDVAIAVGPLDQNLFQTYHLFNSPFTLIMHSSHPLANQKLVRFEDLHNEELVVVDNKYKTYYNFITACHKHGFSPKISEYVDGALNIYYMCRSNENYIGFLIGYLPSLFSADSGMCCVPFDMSEYCLELYIATVKGRYRPYTLYSYIEYIRNYDFTAMIE